MQAEYRESLEEIFLSKYFQFGDDMDTLYNNYKIAKDLYEEYYKKAETLADDIADGLIVNVSESIYTIQILSLSFQYMECFEQQLEAYKSAARA